MQSVANDNTFERDGEAVKSTKFSTRCSKLVKRFGTFDSLIKEEDGEAIDNLVGDRGAFWGYVNGDHTYDLY